MSKERQKEIIELLEETILSESAKISGGNSEIIEQLNRRLVKVKEWVKKEDE